MTCSEAHDADTSPSHVERRLRYAYVCACTDDHATHLAPASCPAADCSCSSWCTPAHLWYRTTAYRHTREFKGYMSQSFNTAHCHSYKQRATTHTVTSSACAGKRCLCGLGPCWCVEVPGTVMCCRCTEQHVLSTASRAHLAFTAPSPSFRGCEPWLIRSLQAFTTQHGVTRCCEGSNGMS